MAIKPFSTRPIYLQLRDTLAVRIATGEWKPGAVIPNEGDLAREFGVSPGTMRKALDVMEGERLIARHQGRGTFVRDQSSDELADRFTSIRGSDGERIVGDIRLAEITTGAANEIDCMRLGLTTGDRVYRIRRLRVIDEQPFMLEEVCVPAALFPGLEEMSNFTHRIAKLAQNYGLLLGRAEERISIVAASPEVAKILGVRQGSAVAVLDRVVRTIDGRPIECRTGWCDLAKNYYLASMN
jgi:GntR family transcriptional regulator